MTSLLDLSPTTRTVISRGDRLQQTYVIGATGVGKSTMLLNMILHDIDGGDGVCVLDPHGALIKDIISRMDYRLDDVVLLSLTNPNLPFGLNVFHCVAPLDPMAVQNTVSTILNIFEKVYGVDRNSMARIINYLQALIYLFIHNPDLTVLDIPDILDPSKESGMLRLKLVQNLPASPAYNYTRYFWTKYYDQRGYFGRDEELAGVFNKFREMTSVLMYPIFCQKNTIDFSDMMIKRKIVLCKLNADWPDVTSLVGSIFIAQILHAGYVSKHRAPFFVYADEFQNFATYDFARLFAEARKFNIALTISHQTTNQIEERIKETCMQAGNIFVFHVSANNAKELAANFDNTPPPGEWIYEKQMRRVKRSEPMAWWEPEWTQQQYNQLVAEAAGLYHQIERVAVASSVFYKERSEWGHSYGGDASYDLPYIQNTHLLPQQARQDMEKLGLSSSYFPVTKSWKYHDIQAARPGRMREIKWYTAFACLYGVSLPDVPYTTQQQLRSLLNRFLSASKERDRLYQDHYHYGTREIDLGWYEPVPVYEPEELQHLREMMRVLYKEEFIMGENVKYTARLGPSPYSSNEMTDRIANKLTHLPNYTACVKTPSGEVVVTTIPPRQAVSEQEFRQRIRAIWRMNLRLGYVRTRDAVDQMLMQRAPLVPPVMQTHVPPRQQVHPTGATPIVQSPPLPQKRRKR